MTAILIVIGGVIYLTLDMLPIDDSDLALIYEDIPQKQNAFYYFDKANQAMYFPESEKDRIYEMLEEGIKDEDVEFAKEILDKNKKTFEYFEEGLTKDKFQVPEYTQGLIEPLDYIFSWLNIAQLSILKSKYLIKQGEQKVTLDEIFRVIKFGDMIQHAKGGLVNYMIGSVIKSIGTKEVLKINSEINLSKKEYKSIIRQLTQYEDSKEALKQVCQVEYKYIMLWTINIIAKGSAKEAKNKSMYKKLLTKVYFKPNKTKRKFADITRILIENAGKRYYKDVKFINLDITIENASQYFEGLGKIDNPEQFAQAWETKDWMPEQIREMWYTENFWGELTCTLCIPGLEMGIAQKYKDIFELRTTQILIALKAYKDECGQLPESLDELVPAYFDQVPIDPYNGEPIKYSKKDKIIYCVGENLEDNGVDESEESLLSIEF